MFGSITDLFAPHQPRETGLSRSVSNSGTADIYSKMENLLNRAFRFPPLCQLISNSGSSYEPPLEIFTDADKVLVYVELHGFNSDEIEVEVTPDTVLIQGGHKNLVNLVHSAASRPDEERNENRFQINCTLPVEINPILVKADFKDGILKLELPNFKQSNSKSVKIQVNAK